MSAATHAFSRQAFATLAGLAFLLAGTAVHATGSADQAWQNILALDRGPKRSPRDRADALLFAREHLARQADGLARFLAEFPRETRREQARVRLAAVRLAEARLPGGAAAGVEAERILAAVESDPASPAAARADARYLRLSESMQRLALLPPAIRVNQRATLLAAIREFASRHASDRRIAGLLVEVATLFDQVPVEKRRLLLEAETLAAKNPGTAADTLRRRIADDVKRLNLVGQTLELRLEPVEGAAIELSALRGRTVVLVFWASWSAPSLRVLEEVRAASAAWEEKRVAVLTVSLDENPAHARSALGQIPLRFPLLCDGRGWEGPTIRRLGINALPTVFVLDRSGRLGELNASGRIEAAVRESAGR